MASSFKLNAAFYTSAEMESLKCNMTRSEIVDRLPELIRQFLHYWSCAFTVAAPVHVDVVQCTRSADRAVEFLHVLKCNILSDACRDNALSEQVGDDGDPVATDFEI